jgi:hypothetical protein
MTTRMPTQCVACVHLRSKDGGAVPTCDAFPGGIPNSIAYYGADHREARRGDHGVQFELRPGAEARFDDWLFVYAPNEYEREHRADQTAGG